MAVPDFADIARRFAPILYFHKHERFFPSDAKRYLEHCALWRAGLPRDDKTSWGIGFPGRPSIARRGISAMPREPALQSPTVFLGSAQAGTPKFPFLFMEGSDEGFLDLAGWVDEAAISPSSENRYAKLDEMETLYNQPSPGGNDRLRASRFWYHAEVFDLDRLQRLMVEGDIEILLQIFRRLKDPLLVCYYLFFPGHDQPLENCPKTTTARLFGSFAGAWACIAVLCEGDGRQTKYVPAYIGLTQRSAGAPVFLGDELRVGMTVSDWADANVVTVQRGPGKDPGVHPRIFVANGTHSLYLRAGDNKVVPVLAPNDPSVNSCGETEVATLPDPDAEPSDDDDRPSVGEIYIKKTLWSALICGLGAPFCGLIATGLEGAAADLAPYRGTATPQQFDHAPPLDAEGNFGKVIHPRDLMPPNALTAERVAWPTVSDNTLLNEKIDGRTYSLLVRRNRQHDPDANDPGPDDRQIWWPGENGQPGFAGRWGPRVTHDQWNRRAGMKFPEFWRMFAMAFARFKSR